MISRFICFSAFILFAINGFSCLNESRTSVHGQDFELGGLPTFYHKFDLLYCQAFVDHYDLDKKDEYDYLEISDVGIHMAHLAMYEEALDLFRSLYAKHDTDYTIVSNLGTLYELNGMNDSAYFFIKKSVELNPDSHYGTEWVHLKILEAKMELETNPEWLLNHSVFSLELTNPEGMDSWDYAYVIMDTIWDIAYQMVERIPFTPTPDLILADIFTEIGYLYQEYLSVEDAYYCYQIALHYDPQQVYDEQSLLDEIQPVYDTIYKNATFDEIFQLYSFWPEGEIDEIGMTEAEILDKNQKERKAAAMGTFEWGLVIGSIVAGCLIILMIFRVSRR